MSRRRLAATAAVLMVATMLLGCFSNFDIRASTQTPKVGERVEFWAETSVGCSRDQRRDVTRLVKFSVNGQALPGSSFTPDAPGDYTITASFEKQDAQLTLTATAAQAETGTGDVAMSQDVPDPATLERIFLSGNDAAVSNNGTPVSFTVNGQRRVREIWTYHWNDAKGTTAGGTITLKAADGSTVGAFDVTRTQEGQGGVPNAYWIADVDLQLAPGTYTIEDSDPSTWAQNSGTGGKGHAWVMAEK